jgi:hypothetical protein
MFGARVLLEVSESPRGIPLELVEFGELGGS